MIIKLDYREKDLHIALIQMLNINQNIKQHIEIVIENLSIGDIIICDKKGAEKMIIERKSLKDLAASICDGRYECGHQESEREGCTYDCAQCNGLLIFIHGGVLDFHKYLHYANQGQWPIDGKDTGVLNT